MLTLTGVRVVDPVARTVSEPTALHIDGERIADPPAEDGTNGEVIDCTGRFVMPGMVDAHVHLKGNDGRIGARDLPGWDAATPSEQVKATFNHNLHSYLRCGVTSLFDAGNDPDVIYNLRRWGRDRSLVCPRIHCTGHMLTSPEGHGAGVGTFVGKDTDVVALLAEHLKHDPDVVKIAYDEHNWGVRPLITILSPDLLRRLIDGIHAAGHRVIVHASSELRAREVLAAGADVLAHPVIQSPVTEEFVDLVAELGTPVVSTLAIGERYFRLVDDPGFNERGMHAVCGDPDVGQKADPALSSAGAALPWTDWMRVMTPIAQENLRRLTAAGAVVATGTDLSFGPDHHRELELLQDAGIPAWDVVRSATHHGALALGRGNELGSVAPGALADLVVLDEDPTQDVRHLRTITHVLVGGRPVDLESLDLAVTR
jgi:imidazolonepropionase-like amidohydrolase